MRVLNFGSLNLDFVYSVDHIVEPGETISSTRLDIFPGGKGLNQSIALARAGANVCHAGMVGPDGELLLCTCRDSGVDVSHVRTVEDRSGNAIIQVSSSGQNSIVLYGGANQQNDEAFIDSVLARFGQGDFLLLQNEVNLLNSLIEKGKARGMRIALNPSPYNSIIDRCDLGKVDLLLMNEVEGEQITGHKDPDAILDKLRETHPHMEIVLTLGGDGVAYLAGGKVYRHGIFDVPVVDTTAAGDTFTGYFLASLSRGLSPDDILKTASAASSLAVSRKGATPSIPKLAEVEDMLASL